MKKAILNIKLFNKLFLIILLNIITIQGFSQVRKPFTQRTSAFTPTRTIYSINGDFTMIGNTNLTLQNYTTTGLNSNNNMIKVDTDGDPTTNNSSSSELTFSTENQANPACSQVVFAGLYWSARTDGTPTELQKRTIKFKGPNQSNYTTLEATSGDIYYPGDDNMYVGYVEVTSLVQQGGIGNYSVADIALTTGNGGSTGYYGGWGLVVVYENSKMQKRDVTVFDGYAYVVGGTAQWNLPVTGFNTVLSGPVNTKLGMIAGEGDVGITGDKFEIQKQNTSNWQLLNHASNVTNNFFNSSIFTGNNSRNPNLVNNTGMDISMFTIPNVNNEVITNGQTSTTFRYSSTQDTYIIYSICMAVDAYEPLVEGFLSLVNINGTPTSSSNITVNPGDNVQYKVQIRNKGNEPVNNTRIEIPLPYAAISYLGSTTNAYTPATTTTQTYIDANASANGSLIWDFGTLPVPSNPDDLLGELVFNLKVSEDCELYQNYNCAAPQVEINGSISGIGVNTGIQVDDQPFYVGYTQNGSCSSEPVLGPFNINIDSYNWVATNCSLGDTTREFYFCNRTTPIPITDVIGFYPAGTRFFNTGLTIEYTLNNPFPNQAGIANYKALLPSGCLLAFSLTINNTVINSIPNVSTSAVNYCNGAQSIPLTATTSNPSYQLFYFEPGSTIAQTAITPSTLVNGTIIYEVAEGPSSSCISTSRANIPVTINPNPTITATVNQIPCYGSYGNVELTSNGGTGLLSYSNNNAPTTTLIEGEYIYIVIDENGCTDTTVATVNPAPSLPNAPTVACYESYAWNSNTCQYDITGTQPPQPTLSCWANATFNNSTCQWDITGTQPQQPTLACYETAEFNNTSCQWDVTGTQPQQPALACYETTTFNTTSCAWDVTGTQPQQPTLACYETATFNTTSCAWDVTGTQPQQPTLACYETAAFNNTTCSWDISGSQPALPALACYETATFNTTACAWDITGTQPQQPTLACYETASFNTTSCAWIITGSQPSAPSIACYETATWNGTTCQYDVTGTQPLQPSLACYQTASFNSNSCQWVITGSQPAQPSLLCYQTATFNNTSCCWIVTGSKPPKPTLACYQTAYFSNVYCRWIVNGTQPTQPSLACYQTAAFNNTTCSWVVTGTQPSAPTLACYQTASFNNATCTWNVSGSQPAQPTLACYETATFNATSCAWDITGTQPQQPALACYQTASFNSNSCQWVVTGSQPVQPSLACYQTASFNTTSCQWDVTGTQPAQPTLACYQTASFNNTSCSWVVTGCKPPKPTLACYQTAYFSNTFCRWIVNGTQPTQPTLACYQSATFNNTSCSWVVTGSQPAQPALACYQTANFNSTTCSWDVTGTPNSPITTNATTCSSYTWNINGQTYTQSGNYYYNSNCQDYVLSLNITPSVKAPATPSIILGPTNNLCNMQNVVYSVTNVTGLTYNWMVPSGATIVSGQGTNSIIVNFSSTLGSCNTCSGPQITVSASNGCLSSPVRRLSITIYPNKPGSITGPFNTTPNQIVTYSILPVPGATSYTWQKSAGWTIISGQGTTSIQVIAGTTRGKILVKANNDCGSSGFRLKYVNSCYTIRIIGNDVKSTTKIYPNPTNGILNIETSKSIEKIEILNLLGSVISTFGNERLLDLSSYHDGIYLIRTTTDEGVELKRVEVIH